MLKPGWKALCVTALALGMAFCTSAPKENAVDNESNPEYQFKKATVAMNYGLHDQAILYAKNTLALDPGNHEALNLMGLAYIQLGNWSAAAEALEKCVEIKPDFPDGFLNLGRIYERLNRPEQAASSFERAFGLGGSAEAAFSLGKLLFDQGKLGEALDYASKAAEKEPSAGVFNLIGVIFNKMERYKDAIGAFDRAIQISPKDIITRLNLGIALVNAGDYVRARNVFEYILPYVEDQVLKDRINQYLELIKDKRF